MSENGRLPTTSQAQTTGFKAEKCFVANCPENWLPKGTDGTDDFGIDYQVQVLENSQASDMFRVQLKGTAAPDLSADGTHFSIQLKAPTIRYYARFTEPILLVLCDLSANSVAIKCPLHHVWIHDELRRLNARNLPDEQLFVTLRIPKANVLDGETNLAKDLSQFRALANIGTSLDMTLEAREPALDPGARAALLEKLPGGFSARSAALMESLAEEPATVWPNRPLNSMAWLLHEAERNLNLGAFSKAEEALANAEAKLAMAVSLEVAEYWYLNGRAKLAGLSHEEACKAFEKAMDVAPAHSKYEAAWAETKLSIAFSEGGSHDVSEVYGRLTSREPAALSIKARLLAAEQRHAEAEEVLASFSGLEQLSAQALVNTMRSKSAEALLACEAGLALPNVKDSTRLLFVILKARAQFSMAVGLDPEAKDDRIIVPITGTQSTDLSLLLDAWKGMEAAIDGLRATGWPANIEFVADMVNATASILRKQDQALSMLSEAAEKRPSLQSLQAAVESLAAQKENFELAIKANSRLHPSSETTLRKILLLHMAERDAECVALFKAEHSTVDKASPTFGQALTVAVSSAHRLVKTDLVNAWLPLFDGSPELAQQRAVWEFVSTVSKNKARRPQALDALFNTFESQGRPPSLAIHLFYELSPHAVDGAARMISAAEALTKDRLLPLDGILLVGQALTTLERWSDLLSLAEGGQRRFPDEQMLVAVAALALDRLGRTSEARAMLLPLIDGGAAEPFILGTHIDIATRCGFSEEAVSVAEKLVSVSAEREKKVHHLRLLHNLVRVNGPKDPRAYDIAWRIGELIDQDDEIAEGAFLMMVMMSSHPEKTDAAQIAEYQERLRNYTVKFPNSSVLRSATIPDHATPDEIMASMLALSGDTFEGLEAKRLKEEELDAEQKHVPFAWRPKVYSRVARDLPQLWEMSKKAKGADWKLLLSMVPGQWNELPWDEMRGKIPLMDLTSLLVAHDLKILDFIFKLFSKVAVSQRSMLELGRLADPLGGSFARSKCRDIQAILKKNFGQLLQPRASIDNGRDVEVLNISAEIKELSHQHPYILYSDDAYFQIFCQEGERNPRGICALDVLAAMERRRLLTTREVAKKVAMLCSWGVGVAIRQNWQIAILPNGLAKVSDIAAGVEALRNSKLCIAMFNGMWEHPSVRYPDVLAHAGSLVALMAFDKHQNALSMASLMVLWHEKAMRLPGAPPDALASLAFLLRNAASTMDDVNASPAVSLRLWKMFFLLAAHDQGKPMDEQSFTDAVSMLAAAIANHDLNVKRFGQRSLKRFFDLGLKDGSTQKFVLKTGYDWWRKSLMKERELSSACLSHYVQDNEERPAFWREWNKKTDYLAASYETSTASIIGLDTAKLSAPAKQPRAAESYRQVWRSAQTDMTIRWAALSKTPASRHAAKSEHNAMSK